MELKLEQIIQMHPNCEILACDEDTEIHIFDHSGICINSYSWYGYDGEDGEYRSSFCGIGESKEAIINCYMEDHCSIRCIHKEN